MPDQANPVAHCSCIYLLCFCPPFSLSFCYCLRLCASQVAAAPTLRAAVLPYRTKAQRFPPRCVWQTCALRLRRSAFHQEKQKHSFQTQQHEWTSSTRRLSSILDAGAPNTDASRTLGMSVEAQQTANCLLATHTHTQHLPPPCRIRVRARCPSQLD